jgi:hypothetical protein
LKELKLEIHFVIKVTNIKGESGCKFTKTEKGKRKSELSNPSLKIKE